MSLSGTLEIFPLEEVLRLLARSRQNGCLRVEGPGAGRIYIESGSLTYASVEPDEAIRGHLLASGIATDDGLSRLDVSGGALTETLSPAASGASLTELIREQCVESIYRIRRPGGGDFQFLVDAQPRYPTGQAFDLETVISESDRRAAEWADIESVVPDLTTPWRMVPEIDEESVNLSDTAWRFLAAMDGSCAVDDLSARLGLTTFQTARRMAELSRARLVEPVALDQPVSHEPALTASQPAAEPFYPEPTPEPAEEPEPHRSWWLEGSREAPEEPAHHEMLESEEAPEADRAAPDREPETDPAPVAEGEDEGDDSFLETVFGELEKTEEADTDEDDEDDDDDEGGFGLLRRRGLGAAFRELADS